MSPQESSAVWLSHLLSTEPSDRPAAEASIADVYRAAGLEPPRWFCWFDSPVEASAAAAVLVESSHPALGPLLGSARRSSEGRQRFERVAEALQAAMSLAGLPAVRTAAGPSLGMLRYPPTADGMLQPAIVNARFELYGDDAVSALFTVPDSADPINRAEQGFWGTSGALASDLNCPVTFTVLAASFYQDYSWSNMAKDEQRAGGREAPPLLRAAWSLARAGGMAWPFAHVAILAERPAELFVDGLHRLHKDDGPAAVYRDGSRAYAWQGKAVPEAWILQPESIAPKELRGFDPAFRKHVEARVGKPASSSSRREKTSAILKAALPRDGAEQLRMLREHAGGVLPFFDRYASGDHEKVWAELVALGLRVRQDPYAADALAVAYETMRRVDANVKTLVERLRRIGYEFTSPAADTDAWVARAEDVSSIDLDRLGGLASTSSLKGLLGAAKRARDLLAASVTRAKAGPRDVASRVQVPPGADSLKAIARLEKAAGVLPLSLRAFYDVVGSVDLLGHHASLAPRNGSICPDPLVVYGVEDALSQAEESEEEESTIVIAPDDLHKADTSGGDPYEMAVPELAVDGRLLNERHRLLFVEYLRLCFRFGGFPGYEGADRDVPPELSILASGLAPF